MGIGDFKVMENENKSFEQLQEGVCAYMFQKQITITESSEFVFLNVKDYFKAHRVTKTGKFNVTYLDAVSDSKDTTMEVLHDFHRRFIVNQGKQYLTVEGDVKL